MLTQLQDAYNDQSRSLTRFGYGETSYVLRGSGHKKLMDVRGSCRRVWITPANASPFIFNLCVVYNAFIILSGRTVAIPYSYSFIVI